MTFLLHWLVMINLGGWVAARIAPNHKQITSIVLSGIVVIGLPIFAWWWNAQIVSRGSGVLIEHGFARILANVIGAAAAVLLIRFHERKQLERHEHAGEFKEP